MRTAIFSLLLLATFSVQAFTVTVDSTHREVEAHSEIVGESSDHDYLDTFAAGSWNENVSTFVSDQYFTNDNSASAGQNSNIGASGSYSLYEISYSGGGGFSGWDNNWGTSSFSATITFDQGVYYSVSGSCGIYGSVGGTLFDDNGCGSADGSFSGSGYLEAGTYNLNAFAAMYSGGSSSGGSNSNFNASFSAVPIPAAVWLFGSALAGLGWLRRRQQP